MLAAAGTPTIGFSISPSTEPPQSRHVAPNRLEAAIAGKAPPHSKNAPKAAAPAIRAAMIVVLMVARYCGLGAGSQGSATWLVMD